LKIAYICTNFNNASYTHEAVSSLLKNTGHDVTVVVVDNCSTLTDQEELRRHFAGVNQVHLVFSKVNLGYFPGLNEGLAVVRQSYPEIVWMIVGNNDLIFPADILDKIEAAKDFLKSHAVVSPDIVTVEGEHQNPHVISGISWAREFVYDIYFSNYFIGCIVKWLAKKLRSIADRPDEKQWEFARSIYQGHGACYLLTPRFFEQFEKLWAPTFLMCEEYFLSKQLSDLGQSVFYEPAIQVVHHWHGSLDKLPSKQRWRMAKDAHREYRKYVKVFK
jgi:GT2 family glycosyltransferase